MGEAGFRPEDDPGTGVVAAFGRQLKSLRMAAGMERAELGGRLGYSASSIASYERTRAPHPAAPLHRAGGRGPGAGGVLTALKEEVARAQYPAFFRDAAKLEAEAVELHIYATHVIKRPADAMVTVSSQASAGLVALAVTDRSV
ncbi:helix-turn-helix domain-containing protein [Streptomyces eurythermus]|uniref:helix-turn-helix domain-containing protein n=1 Tax=Streptomyces eurythermus TaxID=42237 RepID=UPI0036B3D31B